jgi:hypothetical protein
MGLKSIFDGIYVDQLIQKNERGEFVIYPSGLLGRGYLLPAEREASMRQRLRVVMFVSIIIGTSFGMFLVRVTQSENSVSPLGWGVIAVIGAVVLGAIFYFQSRLAIGLEPVAGPRLSRIEWLRRGRRARPTWTYWFSIIVGLLMTFASVAALIVGVTEGGPIVVVSGLFMLVISVLAAVDGALGLIERAKAK